MSLARGLLKLCGMNIDDHKHPKARHIDALILADSPVLEIVSSIADLQPVDYEPFCKGCVFIDRLFQFDYVKACADFGCLGKLAAIACHVPSDTLQELLVLRRVLVGKGWICDDRFWGAIERLCERTKYRREGFPLPARWFDAEMNRCVFEKRPNGLDWMFNLIRNRSRDGVWTLARSRWRSWIFQLDVFRAVSADNAWLMLQSLPYLRNGLKIVLAKQAFLGWFGEPDDRIDSLRKVLWSENFGEKKKSGNFALSCLDCLDASVRLILSESRCCREQSPYLVEDGRSSLNVADFPIAEELLRFDAADNVAEMSLGEAITGGQVSVGNLMRWVSRKNVDLFCHYLPRMTGSITPGLLNEIVKHIVWHWPLGASQRAMTLVENLFPGHIRSIHDKNGKNLLLLFEGRPLFPEDDEKCDLLLSFGCDPDMRCINGYTWNEARRYESRT